MAILARHGRVPVEHMQVNLRSSPCREPAELNRGIRPDAGVVVADRDVQALAGKGRAGVVVGDREGR